MNAQAPTARLEDTDPDAAAGAAALELAPEADASLCLQRTWALLLAAALLYVPANLLPLMSTTNAFRTEAHTLMGGITLLWSQDAIGLAMLVFVASIVSTTTLANASSPGSGCAPASDPKRTVATSTTTT